MSEDGCKNDCVLPLRFPRRPGENPPSAHGAGCFCCTPETRISSDNRPALPHFNYRIGTYGTIREWLFHQINQTPNLQHWTHRDPDDPAIALLEGASILGDILTLYQETYANEAFLRTAQWRESISDLVRLLGYRLSPAIGGNAIFAFEIKKNEPVVIPVGFPLKATLDEFPKPADFETKEEITAYPWLSRFNLYRPLDEPDIVSTTTEFYISYPEQLTNPIELKAGDRLIVAEPDFLSLLGYSRLEKAEIVLIDSIREQHGTKILKIKGKLKLTTTVAGLYVFRLGRTFHHFGHNSPPQIVDTSKPVTSSATVTAETGSSPAKTETSSTIPYLEVPFNRPVSASGSFSDPAVSPPIGNNDFPLDMEVQDLPNNVPVIIQAKFGYPSLDEVPNISVPGMEFETLVRTIADVNPISMTWGGVSGTVSLVTISSPISDSIRAEYIDAAIAAGAVAAYNQADTAATNAANAANAARILARNNKAAAILAARAAARADADVIATAARADAAAAEAAAYATAAAIAAAAKKDDATDAAAQAAATAATAALGLANAAKSATNTAAADAATSADKAQDVKNANDAAVAAVVAMEVYFATVGAPHWLDPFLVAPVGAVATTSALTINPVSAAKSAADTTEIDANTAKTATNDSAVKVAELQRLADAVKAAAAADAAATERARIAQAAADAAKSAANIAKTAANTAKTNAVTAAGAADAADLAAAEAADAVGIAATAAMIAAQFAYVKKVARDTRMYINDALIHEVTSPLFSIKAVKTETTAATGDTLNFYGTAEQVTSLSGRRIMLENTDAAPWIVNITQVPSVFDPATEKFAQLHSVKLSEQVTYADFPNEAPVTIVFGNLADADEGKTLPEAVLGSGNATQVFQNFKIPKAPLTYHLVRENTPSETPEVEIYVDGRQWTKVDSFFGRGAQEHIYIVREDAASNSWVQFGDGKTGARLTSGSKNVTAMFRIGSGAYGPLKADTKVQASAKIKNLDKVGMPMVVSGGSGPEDGENARNAAPGKVQSLGRIVSLKDFEAEAAAIPGVSRAAAAWQLVDNTPAVVVTVLMETGRSTEIRAVGDILRGYNTSRGAGRFSVQVDGGKRKYVTVSIQYALKPGFRADLVEPVIRKALGVNFGLAVGDEDQTGLFSLRQRQFSERGYASSIEGATQNVDGVLWAKAIGFEELTHEGDAEYVDDPGKLPLPLTTVLESTVTCGTGFLLSLYDKHLLLTAVTAEGR